MLGNRLGQVSTIYDVFALVEVFDICAELFMRLCTSFDYSSSNNSIQLSITTWNVSRMTDLLEVDETVD